jgi:hypothetical protein
MLARHLCPGKDVLDLASGEGYGSALLAQVARSVVGIDVALEAVEHAAANYQADQLRFLQGSGTAIPLPDQCVDIVVSFETIEHLDAPETFLAEVRRVLRPGGCVVISTPDRDNYSPAGLAANPYHVHEFTREEFDAVLRRNFQNVALCWQRPIHGSLVMLGPGMPNAGEPLIFEKRGDLHFEASSGYARPQYWIAVCSSEALPALPPSVYIESSNLSVYDLALESARRQAERAARSGTIEAQMHEGMERAEAAEPDARNYAQRAAAAEKQAQESAQRAETAEAVSVAMEAIVRSAESRAAGAEATARAAETISREAQGQAAAARMMVDRERIEIERLQRQVAERDEIIAALRTSTSWRVTAPLRACRSMLGGGRA